jgi:hypothetical protein
LKAETELKEMHMKKTVLIWVLGLGMSSVVWGGEAATFPAVMEHYEPIRSALLEDSMTGVNENGQAIAAELRALKSDFSADRAGVSAEAVAVVEQKLDEMIAAADAIANATSIEAARDGFYELSKPLVRWREGVAASGRPAVAYCPMHKRSWLQPDGEIGNPYGGMPGCGSIVSK